MTIQRAIVIVLDGVGAGEAPDAALYGDVGSNSLGNTAKAVGGLKMPNLGRIGLGHVTPILGVPPASPASGAFGRMQPKSAGKDTISGHWELMGLQLDQAFPTFPAGFPDEAMREFERRIGRATACLQLTNFLFPPWLQQEFYAVFDQLATNTTTDAVPITTPMVVRATRAFRRLRLSRIRARRSIKRI